MVSLHTTRASPFSDTSRYIVTVSGDTSFPMRLDKYLGILNNPRVASNLRDLFPFGDIDAEVVARATARFDVTSPESVPAGFALGRSVIGLLDAMLSFLEDLGLSPARWRLIVALMFQTESDGAGIGDLARHLEVKEPTVTATVDRLEHEGLVQRTRDPEDGRRVIVRLTPDGWAKAAEVVPLISRRVAVLVEAMGGVQAVEELARQISTGVERAMGGQS